jgi:hypothetical protein
MRPSTWSCLVLLSLIAPCSGQVLQYGDRAPDGMQTVGDPGMLILFDAGAEGRWLNAIEVFASPAGNAEDEFQLYVIDLDGQLLRRVSLPYAVLAHGEEGWCRLPLPPMAVPQEFGIGLVGEGGGSGRPEVELGFAVRDLRWGGWQDGLQIGVYTVERSHSYRWSPGTPGEGLWDKDWMVRAYVGNTPDGDPDATDLIVLNTGEAFIDRVVSAGGDPLEVRTAGHGSVPREEIASVRMQAVSAPAATTAVVTLANGTTVQGAVESIDEADVKVRQGEQTVTIPRRDVTRIDFTTASAVPIGPQAAPQVSERRHAWGPEQATGPRDTFQGGDMQTAWASKTPDGGPEWLLLGYEQAVGIAEVRVWETHDPGAITKVTALLDDDTEVALWEGQDPTTQTPGELVVPVEADVQARRIKLYLDSAGHPGWNEIDAVELVSKDGIRQWASTASASSSYADR